jgi:eukaryotic-like serine/threonine-protein kinase
MELWDKIKQRRITQILIAYLAGGWIAITVVDTLVDRQTLPELVFQLALVAFIGGIFVALILGWYHGEVGSQKVTIPEVAMLTVVGAVTVLSGVLVTQRHLITERGAEFAVGEDARRVAVLYFHAEEGPDDLGYLADGLTEALIDDLAGIPALDVVSRNGVARFRGEPVAPEEVGRALNAGSVIDGSVETVRGNLRINVQLLDGMSGATIDRTSFTLPADDVLAVRDSVVARAAGFLRTRLGEEIRVREQRAAATTVEGWTLFQRAERLRKEAMDARHRDGEGALALLARADSLLMATEVLEKEWADPTALRADLAFRRGAWGPSSGPALEAIQEGMALANRALEIRPRHARALEARGNLHFLHHRLDVSPTPEERARLLDRAEEDLKAAVEADPSLASAHARLNRLYYERRDLISAAISARQALEADYYLADADEVLSRAFFSHYDLGQFPQARSRCLEGARRFSDDFRFVDCGLWMMLAPVGEADPDSAWVLRERADSLTPPVERAMWSRVRKLMVGGVLARAGMADSARSVLSEARPGPEVDPDQQLYGLEAFMWTLLGDLDEAVRLLRLYLTANPDHAEGFRRGVHGELHWWWRPLRAHPQFEGLLRPGG